MQCLLQQSCEWKSVWLFKAHFSCAHVSFSPDWLTRLNQREASTQASGLGSAASCSITMAMRRLSTWALSTHPAIEMLDYRAQAPDSLPQVFPCTWVRLHLQVTQKSPTPNASGVFEGNTSWEHYEEIVFAMSPSRPLTVAYFSISSGLIIFFLTEYLSSQ